jgi:predicted Fe-Mo cluster-binding NifX family protein
MTMKIAVSASGGAIGAFVAERFGNAPYYVIVDAEDLSVGVVANPGFTSVQGAGPQAASLLGVKGASVVLTGRVDASARVALEAQGIAVVEGVGGTVKEALDQYLRVKDEFV